MDLDLDLDNYELADLYHLFRVSELSEESLREAKKIVLKTHPDKSRLEPKYFLFYSKAYKRLYNIYEFQNKSSANKKAPDTRDFIDIDKKTILQTAFTKNGQTFSEWFNRQFEQHNQKNDDGYGEWLKSDEGVYESVSIAQSEMNRAFEAHRRNMVTVYEGVQDSSQDTMYTDLKQAYLESVMPVGEYKQQYANVEELKRARTGEKPLDKATATRILHNRTQQLEEESAALAFQYAKQLEQSKQTNKSVWSSLSMLTYI
jgi:hypothetical protein